MALSRPKKKKLIIILGLVGERIVTDLDATPPFEDTIYEAIGCQLSHYHTAIWDSDDTNWSAPEVDAWAAFEELANQVEEDIEDTGKLEDLSGSFATALENI